MNLAAYLAILFFSAAAGYAGGYVVGILVSLGLMSGFIFAIQVIELQAKNLKTVYMALTKK